MLPFVALGKSHSLLGTPFIQVRMIILSYLEYYYEDQLRLLKDAVIHLDWQVQNLGSATVSIMSSDIFLKRLFCCCCLFV